MANLPSIRIPQEQSLSDPRWELIQRVRGSQSFRSSPRLRQFLLYVGECAIRDSCEDATEQQIGIHVFQRPPGYDSGHDSIVRSHARLLRKKLEEYFAGEGAGEEVIVEIPKGHYLPIFRAVTLDSSPPALVEVSPLQAEGGGPPDPVIQPLLQTTRTGKLWLSVAACLLLVAAASAFSWSHWKTQNAVLDTLWHPFVTGPPPLVIYANALFIRDADNGLKLASPQEESARENDGALLTGTGAVIAVQEMTKLFDRHGADFILKRSHLVSWDEARSANLIFIGSRAQNSALSMLPGMTDFSLVTGSGSEGFANLHPKPGESRIYSRPLDYFDYDYAVIALLPGLQPGKWILVFSGLSTLATEAAVEYACRPEDVAALLRAASIQAGQLRPFEALLETSIVGGVPMHAKLVTIRSN